MVVVIVVVVVVADVSVQITEFQITLQESVFSSLYTLAKCFMIQMIAVVQLIQKASKSCLWCIQIIVGMPWWIVLGASITLSIIAILA